MSLKTNLHFHTKEDAHDVLTYSIFEGIDCAAKLGYEVLAWTPHRQVLCRPEHVEYAKQRGIILLPGIEAKIEGREILIINCGLEAEKIQTFEALKKYKEELGKNMLIIAPHPYFPANSVLGDKLLENINLFDAIEKSWFYTPVVDFNRKAVKISQVTGKPLIATSDTHRLSCLKRSYSLIDSEKNPASIMEAIRCGNLKNFSRPISLFYAITFLLWVGYRPSAFWSRIKRKLVRRK